MDGQQVEPERQHIKEPVVYRGIQILGVDFLEEKGIPGISDVKDQIDKLPSRFFTDVSLGRIEFLPYAMFSVERDGKTEYVRDDDLQPTDRIIARKRAVTGFNKQLKNGIMVPTDGKMTIKVFSTANWENKGDKELDKDTALYALDHELGHAILNAIIYAPGIFDELEKNEIPLPSSRNANDFVDFVERWRSLPESSLPRYLEYKNIFAQEHHEDPAYKERTFDELSRQEDFGISLEHYLYWGNLQELDPARFEAIDFLMNRMKVAK